MSDADELDTNEIEDLLRQAKQAAGGGGAGDSAEQAPAEEPGNAGSASTETPSPTAEQSFQAAAPTGVATASKPERQADRAAPHSSHDDINMLLQHAEQALASIDQPTVADLQGLAPFQFQDFTAEPPSSEKATLDLLRDVELDLKIELGRTHMQLEDILKLRKGSVVPLDKLAGDPVDVYVNGRLVARGEVLVLNDNFCVRVAQLLTGEEAA